MREGHRRLRGFEGRTAEIVGRTPEAWRWPARWPIWNRAAAAWHSWRATLGWERPDWSRSWPRGLTPRGVRTLVVRCVESGGAPYAIWVDAVRQLRAAAPGTALDQPEIRYLLGEASDSERRDMESLEPDARRARLLDGLRTFWADASLERTTLLVLEDLHWSDRLSLDVAELVLSLVVDLPLMLVATFRPEVDHRCHLLVTAIERIAPGRSHQIVLGELDETDTLQLVARLLERSDADEIAASLAVDRAQGNPLFVEELVAAAVEDGRLRHGGHGWAIVESADLAAAETSIPLTLETIVLSRVDNLGPGERRLLQTASVLGRTFDFGELTSMLDDGADHHGSLDVLEHRGLVFRADPDRLNERRYSFKHALVRDTVYATLLRRSREQLHAAAAGVIEARCSDLDAEAERLAHHWDASSDDAEAVSALARGCPYVSSGVPARRGPGLHRAGLQPSPELRDRRSGGPGARGAERRPPRAGRFTRGIPGELCRRDGRRRRGSDGSSEAAPQGRRRAHPRAVLRTGRGDVPGRGAQLLDGLDDREPGPGGRSGCRSWSTRSS